jgi:NAD(P)-dependent dehydrogenase (short-subunit alcohol dehydrogenase family)
MSNEKKVLIVGGTSCIAKEIIEALESNQYKINLMTFRQQWKIYGDYTWAYCDLEEVDSVNNLIDLIKKDKYSKMIFLPGNSLGPVVGEHSYEQLEAFYNAFVFRYNFLIKEASKCLTEDGLIISISSIAANIAINDAHYSAVKAGVQAFVKSLSLKLRPNQSAFSISPGLIYNSTTFNRQKYTGDISELATKDQIAKIIANADKSYNGKVIEIGY